MRLGTALMRMRSLYRMLSIELVSHWRVSAFLSVKTPIASITIALSIDRNLVFSQVLTLWNHILPKNNIAALQIFKLHFYSANIHLSHN